MDDIIVNLDRKLPLDHLLIFYLAWLNIDFIDPKLSLINLVLMIKEMNDIIMMQML